MPFGLEPWMVWSIAALLVGGGMVGSVLPMLPGPPLVFAGLWLAAWIDQFQRVGKVTLLALAVLTALGVAIDYIAGAMGAKRVGASRTAVWGAVVGTIIGMFFGIPGLLIGPFAGAFIGELIAKDDGQQALRAGIASWLGFILGTLAKLFIIVVMLVVFGAVYALHPTEKGATPWKTITPEKSV